MDRQVAFSLATKAQASGLFKQMMLPTKSEVEAGQDSFEKKENEKTTAKMEGFREDVCRLAEVFSTRVPENTLLVPPPLFSLISLRLVIDLSTTLAAARLLRSRGTCLGTRRTLSRPSTESRVRPLFFSQHLSAS